MSQGFFYFSSLYCKIDCVLTTSSWLREDRVRPGFFQVSLHVSVWRVQHSLFLSVSLLLWGFFSLTRSEAVVLPPDSSQVSHRLQTGPTAAAAPHTLSEVERPSSSSSFFSHFLLRLSQMFRQLASSLCHTPPSLTFPPLLLSPPSLLTSSCPPLSMCRKH